MPADRLEAVFSGGFERVELLGRGSWLTAAFLFYQTLRIVIKFLRRLDGSEVI
jgi:hypothetical protein